jgi:hypothetical protein
MDKLRSTFGTGSDGLLAELETDMNIDSQMADDLVRITANAADGWAYEQALRYQRIGEIGPDLRAYIDFWEGLSDDLPAVSLGSMNCFEEIKVGHFDPANRA